MSDYSVYEEWDKTLPRKLDEEALEQAYWGFHEQVKQKNYSDRDCFKFAIRGFARKEIERYIQEQEAKEIEMIKEYRKEKLESNLFLRWFFDLRRWWRHL